MRGAEMVKEVAQRMPVLTAVTVCVDVKDKLVAKPGEGKPKKVGYQCGFIYSWPSSYMGTDDH